MWELKNHSPFAVGCTVVIDKTGERHWAVFVKGTFDIRADGELAIADEQVPVLHMPEYRGEAGRSSLVYEQDLLASKPRTDLYLNARAHAPAGRPTGEVVVGLRAPRIDKTLVVRGDRFWTRNLLGALVATPPKAFETMSIIYERAYGGTDHEEPDPSQHCLHPYNPIGRGFPTRACRPGGLLPNVELLRQPREDGPAVGYGAICSYWRPRIDFQGTYDASWAEHQKPLLPLDYDPRNLQCAPLDQQIEPGLRGGESIELVNLTPGGLLRFAVPRHYFGFLTKIGARRYEHRARLDTLIIEPDHPRVIAVWQTALACHHEIDEIDRTIIDEKRYV